jgi:hypothetical protein
MISARSFLPQITLFFKIILSLPEAADSWFNNVVFTNHDGLSRSSQIRAVGAKKRDLLPGLYNNPLACKSTDFW